MSTFTLDSPSARTRGAVLDAVIDAARRPHAELRRRQPHLASAALLCLAALLPVLFAYALDARTVNDINVWTKPAKFLVSFVVYYATLAWIFGYLPPSAQAARAGRFVIGGALLAGAYEMGWLLFAAASGQPAHFNRTSPAWAIAYSIAGIGSVVLVAAIFVQGIMVARQRAVAIAPAMRTALVLGAVIASIATLVTAGYLASGTGHWVSGVRSDAGGLPVIGWSRSGGDLRVAHFFALHAQQAIALVGLALAAAGRPRARLAVWLASCAYVALIAWTFVQALRGIPFLAFAG